MNIAVNTRLLVPEKMDGIARFTFETLKRITEQQPETNFTFIFDRKVDRNAFDFPNNVAFKTIGLPARLPILWYLWFEHSLKNFINQNNFDLFLSPEGWVPPKLECKSLAVMHDLNFEHFPENIIWSHRKYLLHYFPKFAKRATRIATVSEYSKTDIINCYKVAKNNVDVVYNGANESFRPIVKDKKTEIKNSFSEGKPYFLFIGTLHPRKNLEHLFLGYNAFRKESELQHKLLVAGNKKWWPNDLEKIYQSLEFKDDIIFLGRLTDEELNDVLASATALTYLPYFEGFGIPILEAFEAETAVITASVTSMPEVADGAAILCDPRNVNEIASAMQTISNNEELRSNLIEKGKARRKFFSWQKSADLLWDSIQKTIKS